MLSERSAHEAGAGHRGLGGVGNDGGGGPGPSVICPVHAGFLVDTRTGSQAVTFFATSDPFAAAVAAACDISVGGLVAAVL